MSLAQRCRGVQEKIVNIIHTSHHNAKQSLAKEHLMQAFKHLMKQCLMKMPRDNNLVIGWMWSQSLALKGHHDYPCLSGREPALLWGTVCFSMPSKLQHKFDLPRQPSMSHPHARRMDDNLTSKRTNIKCLHSLDYTQTIKGSQPTFIPHASQAVVQI